MKSIARFEYGRSRGWLVRVHWLRQTHSKLFSDGVYGGKRAALDAAVQWRDEREAILGKPRTEQTVQGRPDGTPGVFRQTISGRRVWIATWPGGRTSFSIARHGDRRAFELARKARGEKMMELYSRP